MNHEKAKRKLQMIYKRGRSTEAYSRGSRAAKGRREGIPSFAGVCLSCHMLYPLFARHI